MPSFVQTIIGFVTSNASSIFSVVKWVGIAAGAAVAIWVILDWVSLAKENGTLRGEVAAWQGKYSQVLVAQEQTEAENQKLRQDKDLLNQALLDWQKKYASIEKRQTTSLSTIQTLERENEKIRDILNTLVPASLARVLATPPPSGDSGRDQDGEGSIP